MKRIILITAMAVVLSLQTKAQKGLKEGDKAPMFNGMDQNGKNVSLRSALKAHRSVVLFFYRGQWCPYCNKHIKELQDSLNLLSGKDAYVIGVTPETKENIDKHNESRNRTVSYFGIEHLFRSEPHNQTRPQSSTNGERPKARAAVSALAKPARGSCLKTVAANAAIRASIERADGRFAAMLPRGSQWRGKRLRPPINQ